jgi:hypothetical protein
MAPRADARDHTIGAKFSARRARSRSREIPFSIRAHTAKIFPALVLITK